jgi:hypothetical protein
VVRDRLSLFAVNPARELVLRRRVPVARRHHSDDVEVVAFDGRHSTYATVHVEFVPPTTSSSSSSSREAPSTSGAKKNE